MAIQEGNIKLLKSQVMDDAPEGGGRATGTAISDGTSNSIFADISELDRAGGRVNLRKAFVSVDTPDTEGYYGANVIVADPPNDPRVSCVLFTTNDGFDKRAGAQSRLESYLALGSVFPGHLFGNHLAGQRTVAMLTRPSVRLPTVGDTLVLTSTANTQFVRITKVEADLRDFEDEKSVFQRQVIAVDISDPLRTDFVGYQASRYDSSYNAPNGTSIHETVVADAARYYGAAPLTVAASLGDFSAVVNSIYTPLVPSAQVETPIADARINQQTDAMVATGSTLTQTLTAVLSTAQAMYIGGGILPSTLSVTRAGITLVDSAGRLLNQATLNEVGSVDYANGVLRLLSDVFGTSGGSHVINYTPAATATVVSNTLGIPVTTATQGLTWVLTLSPTPAKQSLQVSYLAQGRWYVLTEDGSGRLAGGSSNLGVGNLNYQTGTLSLTLGALPDEGSEIILTWAPIGGVITPMTLPVAPINAALNNRFFLPIQNPNPIKPGTLTLTWMNGSEKTATDSGGSLVGDATGTVSYASGLIRFSPNVLPPKGTMIAISITESVPQMVSPTGFGDSGDWTTSAGMSVIPKTFEMAVYMSFPVRRFPGTNGTDVIETHIRRLFDDGAGALVTANVYGNTAVGTIDYATGAITISKSVSITDVQPVWEPMNLGASIGGFLVQTYVPRGTENRMVGGDILNGTTVTASTPNWAWWSGGLSHGKMRFGGIDGDSVTTEVPFDAIYTAGNPGNFNIGSHRYITTSSNTIQVDPSPATGEGTVVGSRSNLYDPLTNVTIEAARYWERSPGSISLTEWFDGLSPQMTSLNGVRSPTLSGSDTDAMVDSVTFRTAIAPVRNGSFSIVAIAPSGDQISVTADADGVLEDATQGVFGRINYETGVVTLRFGQSSWVLGSGCIDIRTLNIPGREYVLALGVRADSLRYNAAAYTYLPLSADILGLDPVRLPSDGKVPIFRSGSFAVASHTASTSPQTVSDSQVVDLGRTRISKVKVVGNDGVTITSGYTHDLDAGTVTFNDITGYSQPIHIENRIEDMMLVSDAQLGGRLTFTRPLTHDYPLGSHVSSALVIGDMRARVPLMFDQTTWNTTFSDALVGSAPAATFNDAVAPILVTNAGAITERWVVQFTNTTAFNVIGEHVGVIWAGNTTTDCAPTNPATGEPYFTIPALGWGSGWAAGNILRFNTIGALFPIWIARTVQQGPATIQDDAFTVLVRGDIDRP